MITKKEDFIKKIAEKMETTQVEAREFVTAFEEVTKEVVSELEVGEKFQLTNFLTMECRRRSARESVNPLTGEPMSIPAKNSLKIKPGKGLQESVRQ